MVLGYVLEAVGMEVDKSVIYEIKILDKLVRDITKKKHPSVYFLGVEGKKVSLILKLSALKQATNIEKADFIFLKNRNKKFYAYKPTLALDFGSLKHCRYCVGVFSWKNGRPILILFQENLNKFRIVLPKEYDYFIESRMINVGKR